MNIRDISVKDEIPYPEGSLEILESWDARADEWYMSEIRRPADCGKRFPLVTISR